MRWDSARDIGLLTAAVTLILDQVSKLLILYGLGLASAAPGAAVPILPFFNLVLVWNPGVSYGLFPSSGPEGAALLETFRLLAVIFMGWWLWRIHGRLLALALGLVIGGAFGNFIDGMVYGKVADFFHFYAAGYDWYVFNVADAAIVLGVIAWLYDMFWGHSSRQGNGRMGKE